MTVKGIDVASYQSTTYPTSGLGFVFVKATEATTYVNPLHAAQVAHGRAMGLVVGHYHFQRAGSASAQAAYFAAHAGVQPGDLIAVDWEDTAVASASKDALIKALQAKYPHNRVLLYCNVTFWKTRDTSSFAGDGLWIADPSGPSGHPRVTAPWAIDQYGISGGQDVDVANFATVAALRAWATKTSTPQEDDVAFTATDGATAAKALLAYDAVPAIPAGQPNANSDAATNKTWTVSYTLYAIVVAARQAAAAARAAEAQSAAAMAAITALAGKVGSDEDTATIVAAVQQAIANAVVHVTVDTEPAAPNA